MSTEDGCFVSKGEVRKVSETTNIPSRGATTTVDWEQRVDFDRLRAHRLARTTGRNYVRGADLVDGKLVRDELVV